MNCKLILACLGALLLAQQGESFIFAGRFARFGFPFFGGIGRFGFPFGPFGLGGLGGLGFGGPFMGPGLLGPGLGLGGPFLGKRAANPNMTECTISTENSKIVCAGMNEFTCDVVSNFTGLGAISFVIKDLTLVKLTEMDEPLYNILAQKEVDHKITTEDFTFVNPATENKPVILSLYWSEKLTNLGFRFKESVCWEKFEKMVEITKPDMLDFELFINQA